MNSSITPSKGLPASIELDVLAAGTGGRAAIIKVVFTSDELPPYCGGERTIVIKVGPDRQHKELEAHKLVNGGANIVRLLGSSKNVENIGQLFPHQQLRPLVKAINDKAGYNLIKRDGSFADLPAGIEISTLVMECLDGDLTEGPWKDESTPKRKRVEEDVLEARREANKHLTEHGLRDTDDLPRNWGYTEDDEGERDYKRLDLGCTRELRASDPQTPSSSNFKANLRKCLKPSRARRKNTARSLYTGSQCSADE